MVIVIHHIKAIPSEMHLGWKGELMQWFTGCWESRKPGQNIKTALSEITVIYKKMHEYKVLKFTPGHW